MRRYDFVTLRLFLAVAETHSLTRAAEREHLALAAVSKRIRDLETQLSVKLFHRTPQGLTLTLGGQTLLGHVKTLWQDFERLDADMSHFRRGLRGDLRIHANTSVMIQFLPEDLGHFVQRHPHVKIDLEEHVSSDIVRAVREGQTDIGICADMPSVQGLQTFDYRADRLVIVTPPQHRLTACSGVTLKMLADFDIIALNRNSSLYELLTDTAQSQAVELRIRIQVRSFDAICRMIQSGLGIGILPEQAARLHMKSMGLALVPIDEPWAWRRLKILIRDYDALTVIGQSMIEHLTNKADIASS